MTGALTLAGSGTGTAADFQNALQAISFSSPGADPSTVDRTITISVNDGTTDSNTALATIHVTAVNNAPTLDLDANNNHAAGNELRPTIRPTAPRSRYQIPTSASPIPTIPRWLPPPPC